MKIINLKSKPNFLKNKHVKFIYDFGSKKGFNIWIVGGAIRDYLIGKCISDIDFVYDIEPIKMNKLLEIENIHVEKQFIHYGVLIIRLDNKKYSLTSLREDYANDGRHAKVKFTELLAVDAKRRDLTINSLYLNQNSEIIDFYSGIEDIENCKLKFIGKIQERCFEDHLRILRYCRFCSIFKNPIIPKHYINFLKKNSGLVKKITLVKVLSELRKTFDNRFFQNSVSLFKIMNLEEYFLNEIINKNKDNDLRKYFLQKDINYITFK